jgi:hypothetical protein
MLRQYIIALVLNLIIVAQIVFYSNSSNRRSAARGRRATKVVGKSE